MTTTYDCTKCLGPICVSPVEVDGCLYHRKCIPKQRKRRVMELTSDFSILALERLHPAYEAFKAAMQGRSYGPEALGSAWAWFRDGWEAAEAKRSRVSP